MTNKELQSIFAEIFQRQENEVKECGLKTVNEIRAWNFLSGGPEFLATPLGESNVRCLEC